MDTIAIRTQGLSKRYGAHRRPARPRPRALRGRGRRLPRAQRRRQDDHHPAPARSHPPDQGARRDLRARLPEPGRRGAPPAGLRRRRGQPVALAAPAPRPSTCSAACRAGRSRLSRRAHRPLRPRSLQEGPRLLQGQPPEGAPDRRPHDARRPAPLRRADERARPAHGAGLPSLRRRGRERGQTIFLSSHILSEVEALCDRVAILREGVWSRWARWRNCATSRRSRSRPPSTAGVPDLGAVPGVTASTGRARGAPPGARQGRAAAQGPGRLGRARAAQPRALAGGAVPGPLRRRTEGTSGGRRGRDHGE